MDFWVGRNTAERRGRKSEIRNSKQIQIEPRGNKRENRSDEILNPSRQSEEKNFPKCVRITHL
jgi:hypothetical protein